MKAVILESCHSTWIFDTDRMRFRRILNDIEVLKADRSRLIRTWRHTADCVQCGDHRTGELSLEDIRNAVTV